MTTDAYMNYDNIIIGKQNNYSKTLFGTDKVMCQKNALEIIRYAFTKYLRWQPEYISKHMTKELMEKLHLQYLMRYIEYPLEYDKSKDYFYLVSLVFESHKMSFRETTIHTYEAVQSGDITKFPKSYFVGSEGIVRAGICLQYMISNHVLVSSINELYHLFSNDQGLALLKKYKLFFAFKENFETPVDFLHFSLPAKEKNNLYLYYYKFSYWMNKIGAAKSFQICNRLLKEDIL